MAENDSTDSPASGGSLRHAVILAGGRSSRLGGVPKAGLLFDGEPLVRRTVREAASLLAVHGGRSIVVVGPPEQLHPLLAYPAAADPAAPSFLAAVSVVREAPPFAGPAAALAAGIDALSRDEPAPEGSVLVAACDMPGIGAALDALGRAFAAGAGQAAGAAEGLVAVEGECRQPLAAIYPLASLRAVIAAARAAHRLDNASMRSLVARVKVRDVPVPPGSTADIDTWDDARRHGISPGLRTEPAPNRPASPPA